MENNEKEIDEKLYRVVRKKGSHINTKVNADGTKSALQFTDEDNDLSGPLEIIEVDESEYIRADELDYYAEHEEQPRTWQQVVVEDIVVPVAREAIDQLLDIGMQRFEIWMDEKAMPAVKRKAKKTGENVSIFFSALKSAIKGEKPKALQILEAEQKQKSNTVQIVDVVENTNGEDKETNKIEITQDELEKIVALTRRSAMTLVGCINVLRNAAVSDMTPEQRIEFESQIKSLRTDDLMAEINLLLEDKNRDLLDAASYSILFAFREGNFIVDGQEVPIRNYLD